MPYYLQRDALTSPSNKAPENAVAMAKLYLRKNLLLYYHIEYLLFCNSVFLKQELFERVLEALHQRVRGLQHRRHRAYVSPATPSVFKLA